MSATQDAIFSMRLQILYNADAEVAAWVFAQLPYAPKKLTDLPKDWYRAYGVTRGGKLVAGIVWHDLQANLGDVQISIVGKGPWISREIAKIIITTPFERFGVAHCTARHAASNDAATVGIQHLGWVFEGRQRLAWDGKEDALLFGLTAERAKTWEASSVQSSAQARKAAALAAAATPIAMTR